MRRQPPVKTRKMKQKRRLSVGRLLFLLLFLVAIIAGIAFAAIFSYRYADNLLNNCNRDSAMTPVASNAKLQVIPYRNVLVVGLDQTAGKPNADYLAVVSTAPRGIYPALVLQIPVKSVLPYNQTNHMVSLQQLFSEGGAIGVANAIIKHYGIPVTNYAVLDYAAVAKIVDLAGGIDIFAESSYDYEDKASATYIHIKSGFQHFDGKTAVDYARYCKDELGDEGRNRRQTRLIRELWGKIFSAKLLLHPLAMHDILKKNVVTDMSFVKLATTFAALRNSDAKTASALTVPGKYLTDKGAKLFIVDDARLRAFVDSTYYQTRPEGKK